MPDDVDKYSSTCWSWGLWYEYLVYCRVLDIEESFFSGNNFLYQWLRYNDKILYKLLKLLCALSGSIVAVIVLGEIDKFQEIKCSSLIWDILTQFAARGYLVVNI